MKKSSDEGMFPGDWGLERRLTALAEAGFAGIEMNIGDGALPVGASSEDTAKLRNLVESNGLSISAARGGGVGSDLGSGDAGRPLQGYRNGGVVSERRQRAGLRRRADGAG